MRRLLRDLVPTSRIALALWAWRNRYVMLDLLAFGLQAVGDTTSGKGTADARAELKLRIALARDRQTRGVPIEVRVQDGVVRLTGEVSPEVHAHIQDKVVANRGITRVDDHLRNVTPRRARRLRLRTV